MKCNQQIYIPGYKSQGCLEPSYLTCISVKLAREAYFGVELMAKSTVHGCTVGLDDIPVIRYHRDICTCDYHIDSKNAPMILSLHMCICIVRMHIGHMDVNKRVKKAEASTENSKSIVWNCFGIKANERGVQISVEESSPIFRSCHKTMLCKGGNTLTVFAHLCDGHPTLYKDATKTQT